MANPCFRAIIVLLLGFTLPIAAFSQEQADTSPVPSPSDSLGIDPMREEAGDFLDTDLVELRTRAFNAYRAEDYVEAARRYLHLLRFDINDATSLYNLACCYGLMGEGALAARYLKKAVDAGFEDLRHLSRDPDFESVRDQVVFSAAVEDVTAQIGARWRERGKVMYLGAPSLMPCRLRLPEDYDPDGSYPLVIGLHGYGDNPSDFIDLGPRFGPTDFFLAAPQAPYGFLAGRRFGYSWWLDNPREELVRDESVALTMDYIADLVGQLRRLYPVGEVYLLGFSQGAACAYHAAIRNHDIIDGLICFGGWLEAEEIGEERLAEAAGLRVLIAHGEQDPAIRFESAEEARDLLTSHGYDVTFFPFEGGHRISDDGLAKVLEWLKED